MSALLFMGLLVGLNVLIAWWNCYAVGSSWKDVMSHGDRLERWVLRAAVVHSGVGFSMPLMLLFGFGGAAALSAGEKPILTQAEALAASEAVVYLWYAIVIVPIVSTGFVIWLHSVREAIRNRDFVSIAIAGWNTYAQISNTLSMLNELGGVVTKLTEFFGKALTETKDGRAKAIVFVVAVVVLSIVGGFTIAVMLVRHYARKSTSQIERFEHDRGNLARA